MNLMVVRLALAAGVDLAGASLYAYVGWITLQRRAGEDSRLGIRLFSTWWFGVALSAGLDATRYLAYLAGVMATELYEVHLYLSLLTIAVAMWALVSYLMLLFTGSTRAVGWLAFAYVLVYVLLLTSAVMQHPVGPRVTDWQVATGYARPGGWLVRAVDALVVAPLVLSATAYASLYFRLRNRTQRFRVGTVAASFLPLFGATLLAAALGVTSEDWWAFLSRLLGLLAAVGVLVAFRPPAILRRRYGLEAVVPPRGGERGGVRTG